MGIVLMANAFQQLLDKTVAFGFYSHKNFSADVRFDQAELHISEPEKVKALKALMQVEVPKSPKNYFSCACIGDFKIRLFNEKKEVIKAISFHHGVSLLIDNWPTHVTLLKGKELVEFLAAEGYETPLLDYKGIAIRKDEDISEYKKWLENSPQLLERYAQGYSYRNEVIDNAILSALKQEYTSTYKMVSELLRSASGYFSITNKELGYRQIPLNCLRLLDYRLVALTYKRWESDELVKKGFAIYLFYNRNNIDFKQVPLAVFEKSIKIITTQLDTLEQFRQLLDLKYSYNRLHGIRSEFLPENYFTKPPELNTHASPKFYLQRAIEDLENKFESSLLAKQVHFGMDDHLQSFMVDVLIQLDEINEEVLAGEITYAYNKGNVKIEGKFIAFTAGQRSKVENRDKKLLSIIYSTKGWGTPNWIKDEWYTWTGYQNLDRWKV